MNSNLIVEIAPFTVADGVDEHALVAASDAVQSAFLKHAKGWVGRFLLKGPNNQWMDIVLWRSLAEAEAAAKDVTSHPACLKYFELMDQTTVEPPKHFEQIKEYRI